MHEDILKFRKLCGILKKEKCYNYKSLQSEIGVSEPTLAKLLKAKPEECKFYPSILGKVQDFIRKHIDDLNYAGIKPTEQDKRQADLLLDEKYHSSDSVKPDPEEVEKIRKNLSNYGSKTDKEDPESGSRLVDLLTELSKLVPSNVQIIINPK
jgi:hypothetical protein